MEVPSRTKESLTHAPGKQCCKVNISSSTVYYIQVVHNYVYGEYGTRIVHMAIVMHDGHMSISDR